MSSSAVASFSTLSKPLAASTSAALPAFSAAVSQLSLAAPLRVAPLAAFSTEAAAAPTTGDAAPEIAPVVIENAIATSTGFVSHALRPQAELMYRNLPIGEAKLDLICRLIRGLSVREAIAQLRLSERKHTYWFRRALENLTRQAVHNFNMAPERLVVQEVYSTRANQYIRADFKGRSRLGFRYRYHSHLFIKVGEQKYHPNEIRIGRLGPTITHINKVNATIDAWKARKSAD